MKFYFLTLLVWIPYSSLAQKSEVTLHIIPTMSQELLELGKTYYVKSLDDSVRVETLKFYIADIQLNPHGHTRGERDNTYHLLDAEKPKSLEIPLSFTSPNPLSKISFQLGVDSLSSTSGVFGGALDPMLGMYWTWQSGYINIKIEGTALKSPARNQVFQYHIGGYQAPFETLQQVELEVADTSHIRLHIPVDQFLAEIAAQGTYQIMSPNQKAVKAAQQFVSLMSVLP